MMTRAPFGGAPGKKRKQSLRLREYKIFIFDQARRELSCEYHPVSSLADTSALFIFIDTYRIG